MPARAAFYAGRPPPRNCVHWRVWPRDERAPSAATACAGGARARTAARHACHSLPPETPRHASDARPAGLTIGVALAESRRGLRPLPAAGRLGGRAVRRRRRCKCSGAAETPASQRPRRRTFRLRGMRSGVPRPPSRLQPAPAYHHRTNA
ncbi:jg10412 [Pararge aegeria aegeria]|uniref:Jg10412 protein n=1 Tax=Pararge aegeria aegeria TaxID=348720 RepID=A0A8S4RQI1_9NEOP|nr:jg10412 [Pararge aegeria aegeria]